MRLPLVAAAALLAIATRAGAEPVAALRLGVAPAFGSAAEGAPVSDAVALQFPVQLDVLWRYRHAAAGAYGSWGYGRVHPCAGSCSAYVWRAGLQATWTFSEIRGAEPWAGIASGYEWARARLAAEGTETTTVWRGWELFALQGGVEWHVARAFALGPFVLVGLGRYTDLSVDTSIESASAPIASRALHGWVHVGIRGRLDLRRR